jgi:hypothetical protein
MITLPEKEDMLARLRKVFDDPYAENEFYSRLLREAGTEKEPEGVALMFALAVRDYTEGMPPAAQMTMSLLVPGLVSALVEDETARARVLEVLG